MDNSLKMNTRKRIETKDLVITALLIALVYVTTNINVFIPFMGAKGGLVHLGNTALFTAAIVFGKKKGAIAGAVGMGLFDILSAWYIWAPFTFVIRLVQGYIIGQIVYAKGKNGDSIPLNLAALIISGVWMTAGYYVTEIILYGNWLAPMASIPGDIAQVVIGIAVSMPLSVALKKSGVLKRI